MLLYISKNEHYFWNHNFVLFSRTCDRPSDTLPPCTMQRNLHGLYSIAVDCHPFLWFYWNNSGVNGRSYFFKVSQQEFCILLLHLIWSPWFSSSSSSTLELLWPPWPLTVMAWCLQETEETNTLHQNQHHVPFPIGLCVHWNRSEWEKWISHFICIGGFTQRHYGTETRVKHLCHQHHSSNLRDFSQFLHCLRTWNITHTHV